MSRICPQCGTANDSKATFCGACATQIVSTSTALVRTRSKSALPVLTQREKATLGSVALGLAAVAVRVGLDLLRQAGERKQEPQQPVPEVIPATSPSPQLLIRRRWVIGDARGPVRWGEEEIEVHERDEPRSTYRVSLPRPK